ILRRAVALGAGREVGQQHRADQERDEDVPHAVEAEALAGLVADDEGDLARHPAGVGGKGGCAHAAGCRAGGIAKASASGATTRWPKGHVRSSWSRLPSPAACPMTRPRPALPASLALALLLGLAPATVPAATAAGTAASLVTESERSGFQRTGRYAEVLALCDAFAAHDPQAVRCIEFGTTPEGRPMKALVA